MLSCTHKKVVELPNAQHSDAIELISSDPAFVPSPMVTDDIDASEFSFQELRSAILGSSPVFHLPVAENGLFRLNEKIYLWKIWAIKGGNGQEPNWNPKDSDIVEPHTLTNGEVHTKFIVLQRLDEAHLLPYTRDLFPANIP